MTVFFHATTATLSPAKDVKANDVDLSLKEINVRATEEYLQHRNPFTDRSRLASWFCCDTPDLAACYLDSQLRMGRFIANAKRMYKVEAPPTTRHPMAIVNAIEMCIQESRLEDAGRLAVEYWKPETSWEFWEYLCPVVSIIEEVAWPNDLPTQSGLIFAYEADMKAANKFPKLK